MLKKLMPALALATAALTATQPAFAQSASTYPNKPIHIIVTFTSGGAPKSACTLSARVSPVSER